MTIMICRHILTISEPPKSSNLEVSTSDNYFQVDEKDLTKVEPPRNSTFKEPVAKTEGRKSPLKKEQDLEKNIGGIPTPRGEIIEGLRFKYLRIICCSLLLPPKTVFRKRCLCPLNLSHSFETNPS